MSLIHFLYLGAIFPCAFLKGRSEINNGISTVGDFEWEPPAKVSQHCRIVFVGPESINSWPGALLSSLIVLSISDPLYIYVYGLVMKSILPVHTTRRGMRFLLTLFWRFNWISRGMRRERVAFGYEIRRRARERDRGIWYAPKDAYLRPLFWLDLINSMFRCCKMRGIIKTIIHGNGFACVNADNLKTPFILRKLKSIT